MIPRVSGLSEYGSRSAAPHDPKAPNDDDLSSGRGSSAGKLTVGEQFDTPDVQAAVFPVVDEARNLVAPVLVGGDIAHEVQTYLQPVRFLF